MRKCKCVWASLGAGAALLFLLAALLVVGCGKGPEQPAVMTGQHGEAVFANARCPIMGSPIDPAKVPDSLVRTHMGQKIALCCGGCPAAWDKLTEAQKHAKLADAAAEKPGHQEHGGGHAESHH